MVWQWKGLHREMVESPSPEVFYGKARCDTQRHGPIDKVVLGHGLE